MALSVRPLVPPAQPGPITDAVLENAATVAHAAVHADDLSSEGAALLLWIVGPALDEPLQWRRRMALIRDVASADNVIMMPGAH